MPTHLEKTYRQYNVEYTISMVRSFLLPTLSNLISLGDADIAPNITQLELVEAHIQNLYAPTMVLT